MREPGQYRASAGHYHRALDVQPGADLLICRRQLQHTSGVQVIHSVFVSLDLAARTPLDHPFAPPAALYEAFVNAGHDLHWRESTAAGMPSPHDTAAVALPDGVPLLLHLRITRNAAGEPLLLDETRIPADRATITHSRTSL